MKISELENKIPHTTDILNAKIGKVEKEIPDHAEYSTTPEFNNLLAQYLIRN